MDFHSIALRGFINKNVEPLAELGVVKNIIPDTADNVCDTAIRIIHV